MNEVMIDGIRFEGFHIPTQKTCVLMIKSAAGFLGCGYLDVSVANRVGDAVAIVTGVKDFDAMLAAKVVKVSDRAKEVGLVEGMSGREALLLLQKQAG